MPRSRRSLTLTIRARSLASLAASTLLLAMEWVGNMGMGCLIIPSGQCFSLHTLGPGLRQWRHVPQSGLVHSVHFPHALVSWDT